MKTTPAAEKLPNTIDPSLDLDQVKKECLGMVKKRARVSAGVAVIPVPFFDVAVDAGMLTQLIPEISERFGWCNGIVIAQGYSAEPLELIFN